MAVEAGHLNLLQPQILASREMMNPIEANASFYNTTQMGYQLPLTGTITNTTTTMENLGLPMYNSSSAMINNSLPLKNSMKSDSTVTYVDQSTSRKRSRDSINPFINATYMPSQAQTKPNSLSFLGEDFSFVVRNQQLELERLLSQHMERVKIELEEKRRLQARKIIEAVQVGMVKRLKAKEEEIEKMGKVNWALEERIKSLCIENQIWRDLAQSNEATANVLRANLEQVLASQAKDNEYVDQAELDDAQSCCGSTGNVIDNNKTDCESMPNRRLCKNCFTEESCVLLLPCRHLCLCTNCGTSLHICPVCNSIKNASVHVNMS